MSLVNKMLRDLDARRAGADERGPLPTAVSPLPVDDDGHGRKLALTAFAIVGLGLAAALHFNWLPLVGDTAEEEPIPVVVARPKPAQPSVQTDPAPMPQGEGADQLQIAVPPAPTLASAAEAGLRLESQLLSLPQLEKFEAPVVPKQESKADLKPELKSEPKGDVKPEPKGVAQTKPSAKQETKVSSALPGATIEGKIEKQPLRPPAMERADAEYRQGMLAQRQGAVEEALTRYRRAVADQPDHIAARQALAALLMELHRYDEAESVLRGGIDGGANRLMYATMLARLKVERGDVPAALVILLQQASLGEKAADYQGFVAALLNRLGRHAEAAQRYRTATRLAPNEGRWWAGLGIALDAEGKGSEAREAYQNARGLAGLSPDLTAHIDQRLKQP